MKNLQGESAFTGSNVLKAAERYSVVVTSCESIDALRRIADVVGASTTIPLCAIEVPLVFLERCSKVAAQQCVSLLAQSGCSAELLREPGSSQFRPILSNRNPELPTSISIPPRDLSVVLLSAGPNKINCIKIIREFTSLGLKDSKDLTDLCPSTIKDALSTDEADLLLRKFTDAGATAYILSFRLGSSDLLRLYFDPRLPEEDIMSTMRQLDVLDRSVGRSKRLRTVPLERYLAMALKDELTARGFKVSGRQVGVNRARTKRLCEYA